MASSTLKGLVANSGKLGYQLWHRPLKMASLVYEREIGDDDGRLAFLDSAFPTEAWVHSFFIGFYLLKNFPDGKNYMQICHYYNES